MSQVVALSLQIALGIAMPFAIIKRDMARLREEELARSWNTASFWCAVVAFGPLCIPIHFIKVRRSVKGAALGFFWMTATFALATLLDQVVVWFSH